VLGQTTLADLLPPENLPPVTSAPLVGIRIN